MHTSAIHNASKLSTDERHVLEKLLGRALGDNELVEVNARGGRIIKEAATGAERELAFQKIFGFLDRMAENMKDVPDEELDALIDEAVADARRRR